MRIQKSRLTINGFQWRFEDPAPPSSYHSMLRERDGGRVAFFLHLLLMIYSFGVSRSSTVSQCREVDGKRRRVRLKKDEVLLERRTTRDRMTICPRTPSTKERRLRQGKHMQLRRREPNLVWAFDHQGTRTLYLKPKLVDSSWGATLLLTFRETKTNRRLKSGTQNSIFWPEPVSTYPPGWPALHLGLSLIRRRLAPYE